MILRCIAPTWLLEQSPGIRRVYEGEYAEAQWKKLNAKGYNIYYLPNYPSEYKKGQTVDGSQVDVFNVVFVDFDLKSGTYASKDEFFQELGAFALPPTSVVDSGGGIHAYWRLSDLDAKSYLRLCRRLCRHFRTDEAVGQLYQLMRLAGSINTKSRDKPLECKEIYSIDGAYTCEQLDDLLPPISRADEDYCSQHYDKTYRIHEATAVNDQIPHKFKKLLRESKEVVEIWKGNVDDRSKGDYRLGHLMYAADFTRDEAMSVLVNTAKALPRAPVHRVSYAESIVDKIWPTPGEEAADFEYLSESVEEILERGSDDEALSGRRFYCHPMVDGTEVGFRLGQVIGLVAGAKVGKTTMALNMFKWFVQRNPEFDHIFVSLEQPSREIAKRWKRMCGDNQRLHSKVHILGNYTKDNTFRHLSLAEIKDYVMAFTAKTGKKIGTVVIDHIGILKMQTKDGRRAGIEDVCHEMKPFALETNSMLVMLSQSPREKAGIGDIELDKSAAYGTVFFESYVDFLITLWQPLKRLYNKGAPTVMAYKFCAIRDKKQGFDRISEDARYVAFLDPQTDSLRELNEAEETSLAYYNSRAVKLRKEDKKTELIEYVSLKADNDKDNQDAGGVKEASSVH